MRVIAVGELKINACVDYETKTDFQVVRHLTSTTFNTAYVTVKQDTELIITIIFMTKLEIRSVERAYEIGSLFGLFHCRTVPVTFG